MKNDYLIIRILIAALGITVILCSQSCTDEVIKIIKEKETDTLWLPSPPTFVQTSKTEECESLDTAKVEIIMPDVVINGQQYKDTTVAITTACHMKITIRGKIAIPTKIVHDSIPYPVYVDRPVPGPIQYVIKDTTIYETKVVYSTQVAYLFPGQSTFYIPDEYKGIYDSFVAEGLKRNAPLTGGDIVLETVNPSELAGENWTSDSFQAAGFQWVVRVSNELTVEQSYSAIFRELARMQLGKKYSNDINRIMAPLFDPARLRSTDADAKKKPYLDVLFQ